MDTNEIMAALLDLGQTENERASRAVIEHAEKEERAEKTREARIWEQFAAFLGVDLAFLQVEFAPLTLDETRAQTGTRFGSLRMECFGQGILYRWEAGMDGSGASFAIDASFYPVQNDAPDVGFARVVASHRAQFDIAVAFAVDVIDAFEEWDGFAPVRQAIASARTAAEVSLNASATFDRAVNFSAQVRLAIAGYFLKFAPTDFDSPGLNRHARLDWVACVSQFLDQTGPEASLEAKRRAVRELADEQRAFASFRKGWETAFGELWETWPGIERARVWFHGFEQATADRGYTDRLADLSANYATRIEERHMDVALLEAQEAWQAEQDAAFRPYVFYRLFYAVGVVGDDGDGPIEDWLDACSDLSDGLGYYTLLDGQKQRVVTLTRVAQMEVTTPDMARKFRHRDWVKYPDELGDGGMFVAKVPDGVKFLNNTGGQ